MNNEEFESIIEELLLFMHKRHGKDDKYYNTRASIIHFIYEVCSDQETYKNCMELIENSHILERKKDDRKRDKYKIY